MRKDIIFKELSNYKKVLENKGYKVIYIGLYGSQNYNLDDELSDIDVKAIILPNLHDIIFRKVTSTTIECKKGNIDVKDLITFYNVIKKGNFSYIESIDTEYSIGDKYIKELFKQFRPNLKSILGAMYEKRKALTHEYPSKKEEFDKWGFDPKQLHHIIRLQQLLDVNRYLDCKSYLSYIDYGITHPNFKEWHRRWLLDTKRNKNNRYTKENAIAVSDNCIAYAKSILPQDYEYKIINIDNEISKYIENKLKIQLGNTNTTSAREYRTFDNPIPKKDLEKFPILVQYEGQDISYIIYESIDIL